METGFGGCPLTAVDLAFLGALAFLGVGPPREGGAMEGVGAAVGGEGLDLSMMRRASRTLRHSETVQRRPNRVSRVTGSELITMAR